MSVYKPAKSKLFHYDFKWKGRRYHDQRIADRNGLLTHGQEASGSRHREGSRTMTATTTHFTAAEEAQADAALLVLFKLRDALVWRNANTDACRVDAIMADLEDFAKGRVA